MAKGKRNQVQGGEGGGFATPSKVLPLVSTVALASAVVVIAWLLPLHTKTVLDRKTAEEASTTGGLRATQEDTDYAWFARLKPVSTKVWTTDKPFAEMCAEQMKPVVLTGTVATTWRAASEWTVAGLRDKRVLAPGGNVMDGMMLLRAARCTCIPRAAC